jgi:hypothetical protein
MANLLRNELQCLLAHQELRAALLSQKRLAHPFGATALLR